MLITGECFCGGVKYQIDDRLRDARSCHCSRCRKMFSAQASAVAQFDPDCFQWLSGERLLTSYLNKEGVGIQFCKTCGSTLCVVNNGVVEAITLATTNGDPDVEIGMHIFVGSKAAWEVMPEGVVQYEEGPTG